MAGTVVLTMNEAAPPSTDTFEPEANRQAADKHTTTAWVFMSPSVVVWLSGFESHRPMHLNLHGGYHLRSLRGPLFPGSFTMGQNAAATRRRRTPRPVEAACHSPGVLI